jgi:hypothetical protein
MISDLYRMDMESGKASPLVATIGGESHDDTYSPFASNFHWSAFARACHFDVCGSPPTLAEQSQLGANSPPFFFTESTVEPRYIGLSSTSYSTDTLTQTVYLPCVLSNYDPNVCRDQDPGDLSQPGVPTSTTRYDSPDIKEIVVSEPENFDVFEKEMHGKLVTFAVAKDFEMVELPREEFSEFVFKTWAIFWKEFGGFPFASYTVVLGHELPYGDMGAFGLGFQSSSPRTDWASHEIYHAWNGCAFTQDGERTWFMEGVTYYYGDTRQQLFLVEPTYPLVMQSLYRRVMNNFAPEYHEIPLADMSRDDDNYNHSFVAQKGALVAYLLDLKLQETGHHLGEVARLIYQRYGIESFGIMSNDEILAVFNEVSGVDFTDFFDRYIYGTEALPLSEDTDFEWVCHD